MTNKQDEEPGSPLPESFTNLQDLRERLRSAGAIVQDALEQKEAEIEAAEAAEVNNLEHVTRAKP